MRPELTWCRSLQLIKLLVEIHWRIEPTLVTDLQNRLVGTLQLLTRIPDPDFRQKLHIRFLGRFLEIPAKCRNTHMRYRSYLLQGDPLLKITDREIKYLVEPLARFLVPDIPLLR